MKRMFKLDNHFVGDVLMGRDDGSSFPAEGICHTRIFGLFVGQIEVCGVHSASALAHGGHRAERYAAKGHLTVVETGAR